MTQQENKLGTLPIPRLTFEMAMPIVISMLIQALYNIVDSVYVGHYNTNALEAVSIAFPVQNLIIAFAVGTGVGVNSLLSRHLGEGRQENADRTAETGLFLALVTYGVFALLSFVIIRPFYAIQTAIPEVQQYGLDYLSVVMLFSFGCFLEIMCERLLQATGLSLYSMITQATGAVINIVLDPVFIFGFGIVPEMGVKGAAIATVIGQIAAAVFALILNVTVNRRFIQIRFRGFWHPDFTEVGKIYQIGIPSILMSSITSVLTFGINLILKKFSEDAITAYGIYFKLNSFVFMPVFGLNNGLVPILSYNRGAGRTDRIRQTIRLGMILAAAYMLLGMLIFETVPDTLLGLFHATPEVEKIGEVTLRIIAVSFPMAGIGIVCSTVFQAVGNPFHSLIITVVRQLVVILPAAYLLSLAGNVDLVWIAFPVAEGVSLILSLIFYRRLRKSRLSAGKADEN